MSARYRRARGLSESVGDVALRRGSSFDVCTARASTPAGSSSSGYRRARHVWRCRTPCKRRVARRGSCVRSLAARRWGGIWGFAPHGAWRGAFSSPTPCLDRSGCASCPAGSNTTQARPLRWVARRAWRRGSPSPALLGICRVDRGTHTHGGARLLAEPATFIDPAAEIGYGPSSWRRPEPPDGSWEEGGGRARAHAGVPSSGVFSERDGSVHIRSVGSSS